MDWNDVKDVFAPYVKFWGSILILFILGSLIFGCHFHDHSNPYPVYEARWTQKHDMPEYVTYAYVQEYLERHPQINYSDVLRVTVNWANKSQHDPFEVWSIGATISWQSWDYNVRSRDILVKVRAFDGRIINLPLR